MSEIIKTIRKDASHPLVIAQRDALVRDLPPRDQVAEARAIYNLANSIIRYTEDPSDADTFKTPVFVLREYHNASRKTAGDCVTQTALVGTLARSLNIPVRLRIIGDSTQEFFHVHPELYLRGRWIAADVTATTAKSGAIRRRAGLGYRHRAPVERLYRV